MALGRNRSRDRGLDYWPGFVDALSTLLLVFIFLLSVFMLGQFFISREISGKDDVLNKLTRQLSELTDLLALEKSANDAANARAISLSASLAAEREEKERLRLLSERAGNEAPDVETLRQSAASERDSTRRALAEIAILNQQVNALRQQLQALENALASAETREKDAQIRISDLGSRLNTALAQKVQELNRYRSDFFGRLRNVLGARPDIRVVGDRFVFQSEIFFGSGAAEMEQAGKTELDKLASALIDLEREIPPDIPWVARIDGHTDKRPLSGAGAFKDNWDLSSARAIAVVRYLASKGVSPHRLVAAGFGEFAPLDFGETPDALSRNRRLELKLTER